MKWLPFLPPRMEIQARAWIHHARARDPHARAWPTLARAWVVQARAWICHARAWISHARAWIPRARAWIPHARGWIPHAMKGCSRRMYPKGVPKGWSQRTSPNNVAKGYPQRMSPQGYHRLASNPPPLAFGFGGFGSPYRWGGGTRYVRAFRYVWGARYTRRPSRPGTHRHRDSEGKQDAL